MKKCEEVGLQSIEKGVFTVDRAENDSVKAKNSPPCHPEGFCMVSDADTMGLCKV